MFKQNVISNFGFSRRRMVIGATGLIAAMAGLSSGLANDKADAEQTATTGKALMQAGNYIVTKDGTQIFYKDWGTGTPVVFSHGWPLNSDAWEDQMVFLAAHGYRVIAHDRRGHGRSTQTWQGNDMDTYADDLNTLIEKLDLKGAILVGHSTGGGEVAHYIGRYGTKRIAKAVLVDAVTPGLVKPDGMPKKIFDDIRSAIQANRSKFFADFAIPFFGTNRPGADQLPEVRQTFWSQCMQTGLPAAYQCVKAFSETDFTEDLKKFDIPTLIVHGDDDQIVPLEITGRQAAKLIKGSILKIYPGAPHGLPVTHKDQLNADLLAFIKS